MKNFKLLIAGLLLVFAFKDELKEFIPDIIKPAVPIVVEITKPAQEFIDFSKEFMVDIVDRQDLSELTVLNDEYASRLVQYKAPSALQVESVYSKVVNEVFKTKFVGKYPKYKAGLVTITKDVVGSKDRALSPDDLLRLSNLFRGLSWNLSEKLSSK